TCQSLQDHVELHAGGAEDHIHPVTERAFEAGLVPSPARLQGRSGRRASRPTSGEARLPATFGSRHVTRPNLRDPPRRPALSQLYSNLKTRPYQGFAVPCPTLTLAT